MGTGYPHADPLASLVLTFYEMKFLINKLDLNGIHLFEWFRSIKKEKSSLFKNTPSFLSFWSHKWDLDDEESYLFTLLIWAKFRANSFCTPSV